MIEKGKIVEVFKNNIIVELKPHGGCKSCAMNSVCSTTGSGVRRLDVNPSGFDAAPGDIAEIETPAKSVISAAFLLFILPLVISGAAYVIIQKITESNGLGILGFFIFFGLTELFLWVLDKISRKKQFFRPRVVNLIKKD